MKTYPHVLIGAGIIGLTTAVELLRAGVSAREIAIVDPSPISGPLGLPGACSRPWQRQYGQEQLYPLMVRAAELWPELVSFVQARTDLPTGYREDSTLVVAADRADATHLSELMAHQNSHGMDVHRIPTRQARQLEPGLSPQLAGAVEIPGDHQINPRLFCAATMDVLANAGVTFIERKAVKLVHKSGGCAEVVFDGGDPVGVGQSVYLCNGLGGNDVKDAPYLPLRPVRGDLVRLAITNSCTLRWIE